MQHPFGALRCASLIYQSRGTASPSHRRPAQPVLVGCGNDGCRSRSISWHYFCDCFTVESNLPLENFPESDELLAHRLVRVFIILPILNGDVHVMTKVHGESGTKVVSGTARGRIDPDFQVGENGRNNLVTPYHPVPYHLTAVNGTNAPNLHMPASANRHVLDEEPALFLGFFFRL